MIKRIKLRTLLIGAIFTIFFGVIFIRLFWYQVINQSFWMEQARDSWSVRKELTPIRGTIYDQNGDVLAMDARTYTVAISPKVIQELRKKGDLIEKRIDMERIIVDKLHAVLKKPENELFELTRKMRTKDGKDEYYPQVEVRNEGWKLDDETAKKLREFIEELKDMTKLRDVGLYLLPEVKRFYAKNALASHVLGYMDKQNNPIGGIEKMYDEQLRGTVGFLQYEKDRLGNKLPTASEVFQPSRDGSNIYLTIDSTIQQYIVNSMREVYNKYTPKSMTVIAADPKTGDILGLANMPDFDPNSYWKAKDLSAFYNHAVQSRYEPGSTFKIVTLSAAVQEGIFNPDEKFVSGKIIAGGVPIGDVNQTWGTITYLEGLKRSSNVAFVKLGYEKLKEEKLKSYIEKFGFGKKTEIEMLGENSGLIRFEYAADVAAASYGHGQVLVTPIQQVMAVSAVANGGNLMKPHLIRKIEDTVSGEVSERKPEIVREVIDQNVAKQVSEYLEQVVADQEIGTGRHAYIDGYRVAGKTGTAIKVINGEYNNDRAVVSFIGFAPVEDPRIVLLVVVDDPKDFYQGGGFVAPYMFKDIVSQSLRYMGVPSSLQSNRKFSGNKLGSRPTVPTPDMQNMKVRDAKQQLAEQGMVFDTIGAGDTVKRQYPKPGDPMAVRQRIYLLTDDPEKLLLPDFKDKSLREVMEITSLLGWKVRVDGEGYVVEQKESSENGVHVLHVKLEPKYPGG
ncbi:penicillin-binding transpeptidase domain-containing protein [Paenibacillus alvei]|uniref:Penicillin-binding transpeptidase domain-containing protein n=1 Tax=Paenibacillus alvei TaxID=44250 RepID=A0ABT4E9G5_PAEAL|nr:penicillin-binding transpeptidase domain-containing protein [Paenibacillus alvei]MCY9530372.1 penicillin-binding transpeptidase domain-containing protein [Paenibacillus alvei]